MNQPGSNSRSFLLLALALLMLPSVAAAQSGRASLNGWVAFDGVAYVETQPRAIVELRKPAPDTAVAYRTQTDEHGFFEFKGIGLGEFVLRITAPRFQEYDAGVYIPSDFIGNWAVLLKKAKGQ